jgi:hypothetical protein
LSPDSYYEEIEVAGRKLALSVVAWVTGQPGRLRLGSGQMVSSESGECWVVDGEALDGLGSLLGRSSTFEAELTAEERERVEAIRGAYERVRERVVYEGDGPVAPAFDEFDREVEAGRGSWYVIDGAAFPELRALFLTG